MHIIFHGVFGIENIKTVNKHRLQLKELDLQYGHYINPDSHKKYSEFTDILKEIDNNIEESMIVYHYDTTSDYFFGHLTKENVEWFVEHKCNWRDKQYRLDRYYQFMVDAPMGPHYMVLAVLKEVLYVEGNDMIAQWRFGNDLEEVWEQPPIMKEEQSMIPQAPKLTQISEREQEFQDAYIVVRRKKL